MKLTSQLSTLIQYSIIIISLMGLTSLSFAGTGFAERPEVKSFIHQMVKKHQFSENYLTDIFDHVKVRPKVMSRIRAPLEQRPWHTYQMLFITEWRIQKGVEFWNQYERQLHWAEKKFGVPASIIVATIGVETKYGQHTGEYPVIDALANIAFNNNPRSGFFKQELEEFLLLTREQHLDPLKVMGSYAGAIGQPQFMPSSFRHYAVSYSGNQKIDLSHNEADIIASIANYYKQKGWETNQPIAMPASLMSKHYQFFLGERREINSISQAAFYEYGVPMDKMLSAKPRYKLIKLQSYWGNEYWLGFHNFDVIKRYNSSDLYAMAIFQLSHYITTLKKE